MPHLDDDFEDRHVYADDYIREAYGDPCPVCKTLRWQADCPACLLEDELLEARADGASPLVPTGPVAPAAEPKPADPAGFLGDDDLPF